MKICFKGPPYAVWPLLNIFFLQQRNIWLFFQNRWSVTKSPVNIHFRSPFCLWYLMTGKPCLWRYWKWSFWRSCHFYLWNSYNNYLILSFMTMSIVYRSCCLSLTHLISYVLAWYYRYWRQAATQFSLFKMLSVFKQAQLSRCVSRSPEM